ncbi:MAG: hypothetical protein NW220_02350 [Leptolyngbyaceae cyanobacterium bins.349]|nr:hypothetical protein [Leptolyngbyaceae cyanobacterium bins.349]
MVRQWSNEHRDLGRARRLAGLGGMMATAIAALGVSSAVARAQQALPPPPAFPNGSALPSLAPVPPPTQGVQMVPPAGFPALPQESIYQPPAPQPGGFPGASVTPPVTMPEIKMSYYQVVVPTRPENFGAIANKMVSMGVRPEAIQAKKAPLGPHLAVGPFINLGEAEGVSTYLRSGGMDARVFFQR